MTRYRYYTATTLDGFLADDDHSLAWLFKQDIDENGPGSTAAQTGLVFVATLLGRPLGAAIFGGQDLIERFVDRLLGLSSQPVQSCPACSCTPSPSSRASQLRSSGDAFIALGKTRPLDPVKLSAPSPSAQSRSACGGKARIAGSNQSRAVP